MAAMAAAPECKTVVVRDRGPRCQLVPFTVAKMSKVKQQVRSLIWLIFQYVRLAGVFTFWQAEFDGKKAEAGNGEVSHKLLGI